MKLNPMGAWMEFGASYLRMSMSAGEVIALRTQRMALGTMTTPEALAMVLEKGTAFAAAAEGAAVAAARGGDPIRIATAALRPYGVKTRSNARKLRK
jgi:hypothetical protein